MSYNITVEGGSSIRLPTSGKYCDRDIVVTATGVNCKIYRVNVPTAVANKDTTVVSGDPDVMAHYADANAMVTVRKVSNNDTQGLAILVNTNHRFGNNYGTYMNFNSSKVNNVGRIEVPLTATAEESTSGTPTVRCNANGDIIVFCNRTQNNFGGADYIVTFSWRGGI
jgi:hypothetical protein